MTLSLVNFSFSLTRLRRENGDLLPMTCGVRIAARVHLRLHQPIADRVHRPSRPQRCRSEHTQCYWESS